MADPQPTASHDDLEQGLRHLGARLDLPAAPDLVARVQDRIARPRVPWWRRHPSPPRFALALSTAVAATVAVVLAVPAGRDAVADRLGLRGVSVTYDEPTAAPPRAINPTPMPGTLGQGLALGDPLVWVDAQARVNFAILAPDLGEFGLPDAVYAATSPPGGRVSLVYRAREGLPLTPETGVGLVLTQFRGEFVPYIQKLIGQGTRLERVTVNGRTALWIEGEPHTVLFRDADGQVREERSRLAANTLLWEQNGLTLRLESSLGKDEAIRIAEGVGPLGKK